MSVVLLAEVKQYMRMAAAAGPNDDELQKTIDAAEVKIAGRCGPLAATPCTDRVPTDGYSLALETAPVISLTTVAGVNPAQTVLLTDLRLETAYGLITYADGIGRFVSLYYDVAYSAGYAALPSDLRSGIKELVRHLWQPQRGGGKPGTGSDFAADEDEVIDDLPASVFHLVKPYLIDEQGFD